MFCCFHRYQVYASFRNTSGLLGFSVTVETQATKFRCVFLTSLRWLRPKPESRFHSHCCCSTEFVEEKIEEFLVHFAGLLSSLSEEAFQTQVTALVKLKEHEDAHLGEEVERNWVEVMTQQYVFRRLEKEVRLRLGLRKPAAEPLVQLRFWSCRLRP